MYHHLFKLKKGSTLEEAKQELEGFLMHLYEIEDPETGSIEIGGYAEANLPPLVAHADLIASEPADQIDWAKQWQSFAPGFAEGVLELALGEKVLKLQPGGGFGDLSHPTTRLALELLKQEARGKIVIDIGCGSGILSIAAALMGAKRVIGIDIDPIALEHSKQNAALNQVQASFVRELTLEAIGQGPLLIVMNMIQSEQKVAWAAQTCLHGREGFAITSGVLAAEKKSYLAWAKSLGWELDEMREEEGWLGFRFKVFSQTINHEKKPNAKTRKAMAEARKKIKDL